MHLGERKGLVIGKYGQERMVRKKCLAIGSMAKKKEAWYGHRKVWPRKNLDLDKGKSGQEGAQSTKIY